jgi:hypothetical protein
VPVVAVEVAVAGGVFGIAILAAIFTSTGSFGSVQTFNDGFAAAIGLSAALSLGGALAWVLLPGRPAARRAPAVPASRASVPAHAS